MRGDSFARSRSSLDLSERKRRDYSGTHQTLFIYCTVISSRSLSFLHGVVYCCHNIFCRGLLSKISQVSLPDLIRVGKTYIAPLFDPSQSSCAICCHPSKVDEIKEEFNRCVQMCSKKCFCPQSFIGNSSLRFPFVDH